MLGLSAGRSAWRAIGVAILVLTCGSCAASVRAQAPQRGASERLTELETAFDQALDALANAPDPASARSALREVRRLDALRLEALRRLDLDTRDRVLGFSERGRRELRRETRLLTLAAPLYARDAEIRLRSWPSWAADTLTRTSSRHTLFWLLLLTLITLWSVRRRRALLEALRHRFVDGADTRASAARRGRAIGMLACVLQPALLWLGFTLGFRLLTSLTDSPELTFLRLLLLTWAGIRFAVAALEAVMLSVNRRAGKGASPAVSAKLSSSLRWVGRFILFFVVTLSLAENLTGRGHLYASVVTSAWLLSLPLGYLLLFRFRKETLEAWIAQHPRGGLARALERHGQGVFGFPFLVVAILRLGLRALLDFGRQLILGFEHTRRGLAFLFRRRLERVAESKGHGAADPSALPAELRQAFTADVLDETEVDALPGLAEIEAAFSAWSEGGPSLDVALVGEQGAGKTAWLAEFSRRAQNMRVIEARLDQRLLSEPAVCRAVARILELPPVDDVDALVHAVSKLDGRAIVLLDHAEMLMLRCVGGMHGMQAFSRILRRTSEKLVWVCAFSQAMWDHLRFVMRGTDVFQRSVELRGFSEERIGELVERRLQRCGYEVSYEDILPRGVGERDRDAELERVRERYLRLLWDYSDGMPRVALDYWLRSLVMVGENRVRVRLFAAPRAAELERLHEAARFTLHAVMSHESLNVDEAARVLAWPSAECLSILEMLRSQLFLERGEGRYRVTARYNRAVVRHLRRQHLMHTRSGARA
ncbi:MAG: hypothetical protein GXP55_10330 [Deltaproteobacteria bacterium]|nr:hypothetical protein [Deltaproteobacteria bacterium]